MDNQIAVLVALTGEARRALDGATELELTRFPFRVGRNTRSPIETREWTHETLRAKAPPLDNDLLIWDPGPLLNVSRAHFQIERNSKGEYFVRDRGSTCGTLVGTVQLGQGGAETCALYPENTIIVGTPKSPFVFRFELKEASARHRGDEPTRSSSAEKKARAAWRDKSA